MMFVQRVLPVARERLVTTHVDTLLLDVVRLLQIQTDIIVVCGPEETLAGVITKTDVVRLIGSYREACFAILASSVMTRSVVFCQPTDPLQHVWTRMKEGNLKN